MYIICKTHGFTYLYIYMYIYICMHIYIYVHIHMYMYIYIYTYTRIKNVFFCFKNTVTWCEPMMTKKAHRQKDAENYDDHFPLKKDLWFFRSMSVYVSLPRETH